MSQQQEKSMLESTKGWIHQEGNIDLRHQVNHAVEQVLEGYEEPFTQETNKREVGL